MITYMFLAFLVNVGTAVRALQPLLPQAPHEGTAVVAEGRALVRVLCKPFS